MTVHVVHVAQPTTAGVARCVVDLVAHQRRRGLEVTVVSPVEGWLAQQAAAAGATHVTWSARRSPGPDVVRESLRLRRILGALRPDLVHLHSAKAGLAGRLAVRGQLPTVFQPHAWSFLAVTGALGRASLAWERWAVRWTDRVVCVSEAERDAGLVHGLPLADTVRVVPNGVDTFHFAPRDRSAARARLGLPDGPLAVCVGRLSEQKGQDILLEAWPAVQATVPAATLALVGDGPWQSRLEEAAGGTVVMPGNSDDPRDWYAAADVVVVPSRWEGMALVPLEAGASARSVVITDVAGAREVVVEGTGAVVPREDPTALATEVINRLRDRSAANREGQRGRANVEALFGLDRVDRLVQAVYDELLRPQEPSLP